MNLRTSLLDRIERARPRVVQVVADAGWGKSAFVRALAARIGPAAIVDAAGAPDRASLERSTLDALAQDRAPLAAASLLEAWRVPGPPALVAIEDVHAFTDGAVDLLRTLLRQAPEGRTLVLASRAPLPVALSRYAAPHEIVTIGAADLALSPEERRGIIAAAGADRGTTERAAALSRGWPIAVYLFARLAREGRLAAALDQLEDRAFEDLYAYIEDEIVTGLSHDDLALIALCAGSATVAEADVRGVFGEPGVGRMRRLIAEKLYVMSEDGCFRAPLLEAPLRKRHPGEISAMRRRCAKAREERGACVEAAEMWLDAGDAPRAVRALERAGSPLPGVQPSNAYLRVLLRTPLDELLRSRHPYVALLTSPRVAASPNALAEEARRICVALGDSGGENPRASAELAYGTLLFFASQIRRAEEVLEALHERTQGERIAPERAALLTATRAAVASLRGRTSDARALWDAAGLEDGEGRTVYEVQRFALRAGTALSSGRADTLVGDVRRQVALANASGDPIWIADMRAVECIFRERGSERWNVSSVLRALEEELLARSDPAEYHHIVRPMEVSPEWRSVLSCLVLMDTAYDQDDPVTASHVLDEAIAASDYIGRRHFQISARLLAAFVPGAPRRRLLDEARAIARDVQDPVTLASVEAVAQGRFGDALAFPGAASRLARGRFDVPDRALRVELVAARVTRAGTPMPLRAREFEVLAALALAHSPLARATLIARLWGEDADEEAAPALRTAIHRLRKQLGDPDAVTFVNGAYALGPSVTVDVRDMEATLAALRRLARLTERERDQLALIAARLALPLPDLYERWPWMAPHVLHIAELRRQAAMLLGERALEDGVPADAVAIADAALAAEPLDEPIAELAIRGLLAGGRRAEAVRRARRYAEELARDLGGEPASKLVRELAAGPGASRVAT